MILLSIDYVLIQNTDYGLGARIYDVIRLCYCYILSYIVIGLNNLILFIYDITAIVNNHLENMMSYYGDDDEEE